MYRDPHHDNMHKKEFVTELARRTGLSRQEAYSAVQNFLEILKDTWAQNRSVCFKGFGAFYIRPASPRVARNLQTMEDIILPAGYKLMFKPSKEIRDRINRNGGAAGLSDADVEPDPDSDEEEDDEV